MKISFLSPGLKALRLFKFNQIMIVRCLHRVEVLTWCDDDVKFTLQNHVGNSNKALSN